MLAKRYSQREEVAADKCIAALWIFQTWRCFTIPASHHDIIIKPILHLFTALPSVFLLLNQDDFFSFQLLMLCYISFIFFSHIYFWFLSCFFAWNLCGYNWIHIWCHSLSILMEIPGVRYYNLVCSLHHVQ